MTSRPAGGAEPGRPDAAGSAPTGSVGPGTDRDGVLDPVPGTEAVTGAQGGGPGAPDQGFEPPVWRPSPGDSEAAGAEPSERGPQRFDEPAPGTPARSGWRGDGTGRSGDGDSRRGNSDGRPRDGTGRSGDGVGRSGDGVGRSGNSDGRSGDGVGRSGNSDGRPRDGTGRSGNSDGRPRDGTGRSGDGDSRRGNGRGRRRGRAERAMVPDAHFTSYYGRPVVKPSPWEADIPAYLFLGGLAAGSSLLAAGADVTGRANLRRTSRIAAFAGISVSFLALVHDLGRPARFINMLRVIKPTSPMSVGTWLLMGYGPLAGLAGAAELSALVPAALGDLPPVRLLRWASRPAGLGAAVIAPTVAAYTAVLLSDTATPTWHEAWRELPFVFVGSAAAASGGLALALSTGDVEPARRLALGGAGLELAAEQRMERSMGLTAEPLHTGRPGQLMRASKLLTAAGAGLVAVGARGPRVLSRLGGTLLVAGSACTRFGVFHAGQASARDPRYTVVPQRERLDRDGPSRG